MSAVKNALLETVEAAMVARNIPLTDDAAFADLMGELMTGGVGYVCKQCGGPSPIGVGYAGTCDDYLASFVLTQCGCGYSQHARYVTPNDRGRA